MTTTEHGGRPVRQHAFSVRTAADTYEVSETVLREAISKQQLPAYRIGRAIRVNAVDLAEWFRGLTRVGSEDDDDLAQSTAKVAHRWEVDVLPADLKAPLTLWRDGKYVAHLDPAAAEALASLLLTRAADWTEAHR
jgi:excisionase family DNA binding protein